MIMQRKFRRQIFIFAVVFTLMAWSAITVRAYTDNEGDVPFETSKTDRTLIKEVHVQHQESLRLLKEIKTELGQIRESLKKLEAK